MLDFSNALSSIDPQTMGLLGLRLMQAGQNNQPINYAGILAPLFQSRFQQNLNKVQQPQAGTQNLQSLTAPTSLPTPAQTSITPVVPQLPSQQMSSTPPANGLDSNYMNSLKQAAQMTYPDNQMMQQVAITQAIQESGVNPSKLATQSNNYFGIKSPNGASMATQEYINGQPQTQTATFAVNPSMQASFDQYKHLMGNQRYQSVANANDPNAAFQALSQAGYATDPRYAQNLSRVYSQYVQPLYSMGG